MRQQAADFIRHHARQGEVLVLAPTTEAARDLVRHACDGSLIGVHAWGLRQYAASLVHSGRTPISRVAHLALCAHISHTEKLTYLATVASMPGFPKALARTLKDLRMQRVRPQGDLGVLLRAYERQLQERQLADEAATFQMAATEQKRLPTLLVDLDVRTTLEREFLESPGPCTWLGPTIPDNPDNALQSVQKYLFAEEQAPPRAADDSFRLIGCSTESSECVEIARRILQRVSRFDECAVLLRQPERYAPLLLEAFHRAGIPAWFAEGAREPDLAGRALLTLLHCAQEGLSAARMGEYLSLRQIPGQNPAAWERLVSNAHVIGGADRWERRLHAVSRSSETLEELKEFVLPLIGRLSKLPKKALWRDWLEALQDLASVDSLDELQPMASIGPVEIDQVIYLLSEHLRFGRKREEESRYGKVWVGSVEQAKGMLFRHAFVPGVAEGAFPRPLREDPLLLNAERRAIGMPEVTEVEEQQLLIAAARCATESLALSYGRIDLETGRPRVPSLYIYAAIRVAGGGTEIEFPAVPGTDPIDDFEYDAIALQARTPGSGAYLKRANPRLYDSLLARYRRWDLEPKWQSSDGLNLIDPVLEEYRPTAVAYSVSALENFAACPYRFFLRSMLGLRPVERPEPLQRMDASIRGVIFHRIQLATLRALKAADHLPVARELLPAALQILEEVIAAVSLEEAELLAPSTPQVWSEEVGRMRLDLRGWLVAMADQDERWTPVAFELSFGRRKDDGHDERSIETPVTILDQYLLQGSVDLVERHDSGLLRVTDHKTGSFPQETPRTIGRGEVLQPALYALAVEQIFGQPVGSARLYYSTLRANFRSVPIMAPNPDTLRVLKAVDKAVGDGLLPANPRKDACEHCDFRCICGPYEEQRVKRKPKHPELTHIRSCE